MVPGELSDTSSADPDVFVPDGIVPFTITEPDARERATVLRQSATVRSGFQRSEADS